MGVAERAGRLAGWITVERFFNRISGGSYGDARDTMLRDREMRVLRFASRNSSLGLSNG